MNIGTIARRIIATNAGLTNQQLLDLTLAECKANNIEAKTGTNSIAWYKANMKKTGYTVAEQPKQRTTSLVLEEIKAHEAEIEELKNELKQLEELETQALLDEEQELIAKLERIKALRGE